MGYAKCCVVNCKNTSKNSDKKFYSYPVAAHKLEQRNRWIAATQKANSAPNWTPKVTDRICSAHFIGNKKGEETLSPSYEPKIFFNTKTITDAQQKRLVQRHNRFLNKRTNSADVITKAKKKKLTNDPPGPAPENAIFFKTEILDEENEADKESEVNDCNEPKNKKKKVVKSSCSSSIAENRAENSIIIKTEVPETVNKVDKACEVNFYHDSKTNVKVFTVVRYITESSVNHVEVQTEIPNFPTPFRGIIKILPTKNKFKDQSCGTEKKYYINKLVGPDLIPGLSLSQEKSSFCGMASIKNDEQLFEIAGVSLKTFDILLKRLTPKKSEVNKVKVDDQNRLLIFLFKLKSGLSFGIIGVIFSIHRVTASHIFTQVLTELSAKTKDLVPWPTKELVAQTIPQYFLPEFANARLVIDCIEFLVNIPSSVERKKALTYSNLKQQFTAKVLIGITPNGMISFVSPSLGGRKSDGQIALESGLLDILEDGDVVIADRAFSDVQKPLEEMGKKFSFVMPSFSKDKKELTNNETEKTYDTYKVAKVRTHIKRVTQRIKSFNILQKIPITLFASIDDIFHVCCVLVNLQPAVCKAEEKAKKKKDQSNIEITLD